MAEKTIRDKVVNYNIYKDGKTFLGTSTVDLPEVGSISDAVKGAGIMGEIEVPAIGQVPSMTITLNWNVAEPAAAALMLPEYHKIDVRSAQQMFGTVEQKLKAEEVRYTFRAMPKTLTEGSLEAGTAMSGSLEMEVVYYKKVIGGKEVLEIDKFAGIYKVNGVDIMAGVRKALGE